MRRTTVPLLGERPHWNTIYLGTMQQIRRRHGCRGNSSTGAGMKEFFEAVEASRTEYEKLVSEVATVLHFLLTKFL